MTESKEETRKLFAKRLSEDPYFNRIFEALKQYMKLTVKHQEAAIPAMGCLLLLWVTGRKYFSIPLAERGWFPQLDMTLGLSEEVNNLFLDGKTSAADDMLTNMYVKQLREIERKTVAAFPNRKEIIRQAFLAHKKKLYYLSVPVLLAQADGIAKEMTGGEFFRRRKRRPRTAPFVDSEIMNPIYSPMFEILRVDLPIAASEKERDEAIVGFNRHTILHGQDTRYGTEINSLKAISLLGYMSS